MPFNATLNNLTVNLANAGSSAVISTTINGGSLGDSLESAIIAALVQTAHGAAASKIKGLDNHYIAHKVAHAIAGCAAAAANKGKCQDGAIGAAVGEIVGEKLLNGRNVKTLNPEEYKQILAYSRLVAGTAAGLAGGDVNVAADAAKVAVENNALNFESTPTNPKKHLPKQPDKTALEKIIQAVIPAHAAGAMVNLQDRDVAHWISNIRGGITGPIVITSYGVYAAGWTAPLLGAAGKAALSACMGNPSGCTVLVTQAAEAGAGLATGAVTVSNSWEGAVGSLAKAKAAKQAVSSQTSHQLANLVKAEQKTLTRIAQRDLQLAVWKTSFNRRVRKGAGLLDAGNIPITINGRTIQPVQAMSLRGTPVYSGVSEQEVFALYRQMTGQNPNFRPIAGGKLANGIISNGEWAGTKVVLRNFSRSKNLTQSKWTFEIQSIPKSVLPVNNHKIELKFQ
nr:DUF637 domain-containing protein [Uruburuella testudinis]